MYQTDQSELDIFGTYIMIVIIQDDPLRVTTVIDNAQNMNNIVQKM